MAFHMQPATHDQPGSSDPCPIHPAGLVELAVLVDV
jgi:hypothetical protein